MTIRWAKQIAWFLRFLPLLFLALALPGCDRGETKLHQELAGTWVRDSQFEMKLSADGSFVSHGAVSNQSWTYQGTWKLRDGCLVSTLTNCIAEGTTNFERVGSVESCTIIRADATTLVFSNDNQIISLRRK
jgi:hypothetical protein